MDTKVNDFAAFKAPLYVAWEITHQCNANCLHCYSHSGPHANTEGELSTSTALSVIDDLADAGIMVLAFSGGEPMLRKDWSLLIQRSVERGLTVNIGTNGACVTDKTADRLKSLGVHSVTVSIDSHIPSIHNDFRQTIDLFDRAIRAVRLLSRRGVRVVVGFTPTRLNWHDGPSVIALAEKLGAKAVNLSEYVPAGRGNLELALEPEELHDVLNQWIELREFYKGRMEIIWHDCRVGMLCPPEDKRDYVGCGAGRLVARILPDGTVTPCVFLPTEIGSLQTDRFSELWRQSGLLSKFRNRKDFFRGNCGDCEHLSTCGGCRAVAYAYSGGDPFAGDPHCWVKQGEGLEMKSLAYGENLPI